MRREFSGFLVAVGILLSVFPGFAHHSQSGEFDRNKPIEFSGSVKAIEWTDPHGYAQIETKTPEGKVVVYRVEFQAPNQLYRAGWRKESLKIGLAVTVKGSRSRAADSMNVSGQIIMPDGKVAFQGPGPFAN